MDLYEIQHLEIPEYLIEIINSKKTLNDLSKTEFENIVKLPLFETFIQNSIYSNEIYKNKYDLFIKLYIHKELINDFMNIWQQITKKLESNDETDYIFNDKITIKSIDFKKVKSQIENIIVANSINFLKQRVWAFIKSYNNEDLYLEALNLVVATFISKLKDFDLKKWFDIKSYILLFIDSSIKSILNDEKNLIKYPKEIYVLKKIIDDIKNNNDNYVNFWYKEVLFDLIWNLENQDLNTIQRIWENYFYVLWYGSVTKNDFIENYYPKNFNKSSIFTDIEDVKIFKDNFLNFIKEKEVSKKSNDSQNNLLWKIVKISEDLNNIEMWIDSLDREIGEDNDTVLLWDLIVQDWFSNFEILLYQKWNQDIMDREIRFLKKPNVNFTLLERIIAWTCINEYFTFKEFRDLLLQYWEEKWVWDKFVQNFHTYLSLFKFKDKSNWYQYDNRKLDALIFEQMWDILWFSKEYAIKVFKQLKNKFDDFYKTYWVLFTKYDTSYHGKTKTFRDLWKVNTDEEDEKNEYVPEENFQDSYQALRKVI